MSVMLVTTPNGECGYKSVRTGRIHSGLWR